MFIEMEWHQDPNGDYQPTPDQHQSASQSKTVN